MTNAPAPYRINLMNRFRRSDFVVGFCVRMEANRNWSLPEIKFSHFFFEARSHPKEDGYNFDYFSWNVFLKLLAYRPKRVVLCGMNKIQLVCFGYAMLFRIPVSLYLDTSSSIEERYVGWRRRLRRLIMNVAINIVVPAGTSKNWIAENYQVSRSKIHVIPLLACPSVFYPIRTVENEFDLIFVSQLTERKNARFFIDVVEVLTTRVSNLNVLVVGTGPLEDKMKSKLSRLGCRFTHWTSLNSDDLASKFRTSRLLVFPSLEDPWGMVLIEALMSGTRAIVSPHVEASDILNDVPASIASECKILPLELGLWVEEIVLSLNASRDGERHFSSGLYWAKRYLLEKRKLERALFDADINST